ncbi:hypothetical protein CCR75_003508 [Bremia lactucae]|uniref:Uncharacterized protein n=1 Tax=Bremia lactucae TaxID=4779 RepID=A0A976FQY3_BRELC|nr:hypothetical protein CCR75_003508 [Bremia lactucae]
MKEKGGKTAVIQAGPQGVETTRQTLMTVDVDGEIDMSIPHPVLLGVLTPSYNAYDQALLVSWGRQRR